VALHGKQDWPGGKVEDLYVAGARRNIASFHTAVVNKDAPTHRGAKHQRDLAVMLGPRGLPPRPRVTWTK
jgi:hypothetical protein